MNFFSLYKKGLLRSPLLRLFTVVVLFIVLCVVCSLITSGTKKKPIIQSVDPLVGIPGEVMTIKGLFFGENRDSSFVEIAGSKVTASGYSMWTDSQIRLVIPENVQDGLIIVGTSQGKSNPAFFTNETGIPIAVQSTPLSKFPSIETINPKTAVTGQLVTISGANFGSSIGKSKVLFTATRSEKVEQPTQGNFIEANEALHDIEFWSDNEIRVRIPDGADSGPLYIETEKGTSGTEKISIDFPCGKKNYSSKRTYVIQVVADISNHIATQDSIILLYMPKPALSSFQPFVELNEISPEPFVSDDPFNMIYRLHLNNIANNKQKFSQTYIVETYVVQSEINARAVPTYKEKGVLYSNATLADQCVPASDSAIVALMRKIVAHEHSPYRQAKLIFDFMTTEYTVDSVVRTGSINTGDVIRKKRGDAYDFAIIYTALCRAAGIPALPVSGILVHDKTSSCHWWTEIYFEGFGWFPVDVALAAGLPFAPFSSVENAHEFYFGNLDNQHIAFSRGWKQIKRSQGNSKIVYRPRTYALQSIWEEADDSTSSYSSLWNVPAVLGIY